MNEIHSDYFQPNPLKRDTRSSLLLLAGLLAAAAIVLVLQSLVYASTLRQMWEAGQNLWGEALGLVLQILVIWAAVLGVVFAVRFATQPVRKYGADFWEAVVTGFPLGLVLPFLLVLGAGAAVYIPLGLLSLLVTDVFPFATLQFGWLVAGYLVFLWLLVGLVPVFTGFFRQRKWYNMFLVVLLYLQISLDFVQINLYALQILLRYSVWQTNPVTLAALFGTLLVSLAAALWWLRGRPALTIVYAMLGIYVASLVTGNFSERLFGWGEIPSALLALLSPLLYVQAARWILRRDGTAVAALAAGYVGLLAGLLLDQLLQLRITGQGWISLLWGIIVVLAAGLALGNFLGRRVNRLLAERYRLQQLILKFMDIGLVAGIMAGMFIGGFLAR